MAKTYLKVARLASILMTMFVHKNDAQGKSNPINYPHLIQKDRPRGYQYQTKDYPFSSEIIHIQSGRVFLKDPTTTRALSSGWTMILFSNSEFHLTCPDLGYKGIGIRTSGQAWPENPKSIFVLPPDIELIELFKLAAHEVQKSGGRIEVNISAARFLEAAFYTRLIPLMQAHHPSMDFWIKRTKEVLSHSTYEAINLRERLSSIPVSYAHLSRSFRKSTGTTLKQYLMQEKIKQAQGMLIKPGTPITDIAFELGFSSSQHFASCFRSLCKSSPTSWRQQALKQKH